MKIIILLILILAGVFLLPDRIFTDFIVNHVDIGGDGEEAMDNFDALVLLIKIVISGAAAAVAIALFRNFFPRRK